MADQRKGGIAWCDETWNPMRGCSPSMPCAPHCWAQQFAHRQSQMPGYEQFTNSRGDWTGHVALIESHLDDPLHWKRPRRIAVGLMGDMYRLPFEDIDRIYAVMALCPQHTFLTLTKVPARRLEYLAETHLPEYGPDVVAFEGAHARVFARMVEMLPTVNPHRLNEICAFLDEHIPGDGFMRRWPLPNVHEGLSCMTQADWDRDIDTFKRTPAAVRFVSLEPLRGRIVMNLKDGLIHGAIVGGESGAVARPMHPDWVRSIRDQCAEAGVPFCFKQWGGVNKRAAGRLLDGREHMEFPAARG